MLFLAKYGRSYATKSDFDVRYDIFATNYVAIQDHNALPDITHTKGVNAFTDMTLEELEARYNHKALKLPSTKRIKETNAMRLHASDLPEYVNWYEAGKVSESVDQTGCGACWAFTTATTLESLNAIVNNLPTVPTYSVQYLMDCDEVNWACDGGWMLDAYDFTKTKGIVAWSDYDRTYNARKNTCKSPPSYVSRWFNGGGIEEDSITNERMREVVSK
jgi:C1A family cysteine protease